MGEEEEDGREDLGVENAPVEDFWSRSNSSCSFGGRRGGEGPVANAERVEEYVKRRDVVCGMVEESLRLTVLRARRRDMFDICRKWCCLCGTSLVQFDNGEGVSTA